MALPFNHTDCYKNNTQAELLDIIKQHGVRSIPSKYRKNKTTLCEYIGIILETENKSAQESKRPASPKPIAELIPPVELSQTPPRDEHPPAAPETKAKCKSKSVTGTGKSCEDDEICNPDTGRCVKKSGKTGSKVLKLWDMERKVAKSPERKPSPVARPQTPPR